MAVGIVLAAFMAGLAIGSYVLGNASDKSRNPLRLYAIYEIGIGLTALAASFLLLNISPVYVWIHATIIQHSLVLSAVRFFLAFSILIVPTLLMGATLPILSRVLIKRLTNVGHELGKLYAINTIGAVAGCLAAGFLFIRLFGLHGAIYIAVVGNLGVGVIAWIASRKPETEDIVEHQPADITADNELLPLDKADRHRRQLLLVAFGLSGLTSFAYEIFWTRSLVFILGNTTYAFTLMLTAFLSGMPSVVIPSDLCRPGKKPVTAFRNAGNFDRTDVCSLSPLLFSIIGSESIHALLRICLENSGFWFYLSLL